MSATSEVVAKTRWCPFAADKWAPANRPFHQDAFPDRRCIGSSCMAWRFVDQMGEWENHEREIDYGSQEPHPAPVFEPIGYCGLAGKP